uniref:2,3-bisphosphoglycerate-independent phosphoglycerate mutase n=1 Tax=candidate division CPR3 bacterium TaxID=2268181 RepID=A0A7C4M0K3_UNCC3
MQKTNHPLVLIILDGFGIRSEKEGNAIALAQKPNFDFFVKNFPKTALSHSGLAVGLPIGVTGNSEVGHKSIGSGRISLQTMQAIRDALTYGQFFNNPAFKESIDYAKKNNSKLHLIGMLSDAGGHSHIDHLFGIFRFLISHNFKENIFFHFFTDGRDVPPKSAKKYISMLKNTLVNSGLKAHIASIGGRYFGMDRGENWDRIEKHYKAMLGLSENKIPEDEIEKYIDESYKKDITDEFLEPVVIIDKENKNIGSIEDGDAIIFFNFRPDRMRQLVQCFFDKDFPHFERNSINGVQTTYFKNLRGTSLTEYETDSEQKNIAVAFAETKLDNTLAKVLSDQGLTQLHITETEKRAHITYFLNGGYENKFPGEEHIIVPSPKVKTYDLKPEMSSKEITDILIDNLRNKKYDFYAVNFANTDMVGHTGKLEAGIKAVESVDFELGRIYQEIERQDGFMIITSDHGNIEEMINHETKEIDTEHNIYPAPFLLVSPKLKKSEISNITIEELAKNPTGTLADIMPTILDLYGMEMPEIELYGESKGSSLLGRLK